MGENIPLYFYQALFHVCPYLNNVLIGVVNQMQRFEGLRTNLDLIVPVRIGVTNSEAMRRQMVITSVLSEHIHTVHWGSGENSTEVPIDLPMHCIGPCFVQREDMVFFEILSENFGLHAHPGRICSVA